MNRKEIKELLNQKYERKKFKQLTQSIFNKCDYFNSPKSIDTNNDKVLDLHYTPDPIDKSEFDNQLLLVSMAMDKHFDFNPK